MVWWQNAVGVTQEGVIPHCWASVQRSSGPDMSHSCWSCFQHHWQEHKATGPGGGTKIGKERQPGDGLFASKPMQGHGWLGLYDVITSTLTSWMPELLQVNAVSQRHLWSQVSWPDCEQLHLPMCMHMRIRPMPQPQLKTHCIHSTRGMKCVLIFQWTGSKTSGVLPLELLSNRWPCPWKLQWPNVPSRADIQASQAQNEQFQDSSRTLYALSSRRSWRTRSCLKETGRLSVWIHWQSLESMLFKLQAFGNPELASSDAHHWGSLRRKSNKQAQQGILAKCNRLNNRRSFEIHFVRGGKHIHIRLLYVPFVFPSFNLIKPFVHHIWKNHRKVPL